MINFFFKLHLENHHLFSLPNQCLHFVMSKKMALIAALMFFSPVGRAQEKMFNYSVLHKGKIVGKMQLQQKNIGSEMHLKMVSEVKVNFLLNIKVITEETAEYQNGKLIYSSVYRQVNDKQKANRQTKLQGSYYQTVTEGKRGVIKQESIRWNLMLMFVLEPDHNTLIYSDNFQQFLKANKTDPHTYRIDFPDGSRNHYYYRNGICCKVEINHPLYTIRMELI